ncbi:CsbD family protein [Streptomyces sp. NPDC053493]|uniref:CsbD family protein n=1 Tax=Streptomyces sp. NPDC053493 TaxID=3365705 RepID=UPI0037CE56F4
MSGSEKARAKGEQVKGALKESAGRATGDERLTDRGRAEKARGHAREAKEKTKDVFES